MEGRRVHDVNAEFEHEGEPVRGLPAPLPPGERLLWQGAPDAWLLARHAFHVSSIALYFAVILLLHAAFRYQDGSTLAEAAASAFALVPLAATALALLTLLGWLASRTTLYTITDKRIVMRIGIVLSVSYNLPLRSLAAAGLREHGNGFGDIPVALASGNRIAYLQLWPHARPWLVARPQPMLRCVADVREVAALLADAWGAVNQVETAPVAASPSGSRAAAASSGSPQPTPA